MASLSVSVPAPQDSRVVSSTSVSDFYYLLPAASNAPYTFVPAAAGLWVGVLFLMLLGRLIPRLRATGRAAHGRAGREAMLVLAVTLHNLPEGMAVGVACAALMQGAVGLTAAGTLSLAFAKDKETVPEITFTAESNGVDDTIIVIEGTAA